MNRSSLRFRNVVRSARSLKKAPLKAPKRAHLLTIGYEQKENPENLMATEVPKINQNMVNPVVRSLDIHGVYKQVAENTRITNETYAKTGYPRVELKNAIDPINLAGHLMATELKRKKSKNEFIYVAAGIAKPKESGRPDKLRTSKKAEAMEQKVEKDITVPEATNKSAYESFATRCHKLQSMKNKTPRQQMELYNIIKPESIEVPRLRFESIHRKEMRDNKW